MRVPAFVASLLVLSALGAGSGCKGDREKCAQAAHHFAELMYWEPRNAELAKLPPEQRDAERKRMLVEFNKELESQLELRISHCVSAGADDQADCINKSKTRDEALKCADLAKGPDESQDSGWCAASGGSPAGLAVLAPLVALVLGRRRRRRRQS
jgi:MYXO-CTERM domain-containing protein